MDPTVPESIPIRIIIVEDEPSLRRDLADYLKRRGHQVMAVGAAHDLYLVLEQWPAQILLLDINLPDEDGFSVCRRVRAAHSVGIVMLTCRESLEDRLAGYESGADAYIVKSAELPEIDAVLRSVHRRLQPGRYQTSAPPWRLNPSAATLAAPDGGIIHLTPTETRLLAALMATPQIPVSRETLTAEVGTPQKSVSERYLDTLILRLRRRFEQAGGATLPVGTVYGAGYVFTAAAVIETP